MVHPVTPSTPPRRMSADAIAAFDGGGEDLEAFVAHPDHADEWDEDLAD